MQLKQILKVTLSLIQLRTFGDIAITTDLAYVSTVTFIRSTGQEPSIHLHLCAITHLLLSPQWVTSFINGPSSIQTFPIMDSRVFHYDVT